MSHGYFMSLDGQVVLGFVPNANNFKGETPQVLVPAKEGDVILAYSVVRDGEQRGYLWHVDEKNSAELEAEHFTKVFDHKYTCLGLTHDSRPPNNR